MEKGTRTSGNPRRYAEGFWACTIPKSKQLRACKSFLELMQISEKVGEGFWAHPGLTVYDTALRIGAHLDIMPDRIYLHAGVKEGAKALGFSGKPGL